MKTRILTLFVLAIALSSSAALAADPAAIASARRSLQSAFNQGSAEALVKARARFAALSAAEPKSAVLHTWVALADWRAMPLVGRSDKAQAEKLGNDGLEHCDQALALDPKMADALALKGGLQGMMISFQPSSGMTLGPESVANINRALGMSPDNPRVWLLDGIGTLNKPALFGGGPKQAGPKLKKAQELFTAADSAGADSAAFDFGHDDAWVWGGRSAMKAKDYAAAKAQFERALEINPANGWVRSTLLPEAVAALAKKSRS
jgi:tetratricopeptide (TPR) repeat protein